MIMARRGKELLYLLEGEKLGVDVKKVQEVQLLLVVYLGLLIGGCEVRE